MARRKRRKPTAAGNNRPSLLGSLLLEFVAIAGFVMLMSTASSNRESADNDTTGTDVRTSKYGAMFNGFVSDQFQRTGFVAK